MAFSVGFIAILNRTDGIVTLAAYSPVKKGRNRRDVKVNPEQMSWAVIPYMYTNEVGEKGGQSRE